MDDLISRQAAIEVAMEELESGTYFDIPSKIKDLPSAQSERKQGEWIEHHEPYTWMGYTYWTCSECGFGEDDNKVRSNYCPNCGAQMERSGKRREE